MEKSARRLLDAAYEVLAEHGSRGFTLRAVEARAGLPHGSIRHHFATRAGLIEALVDDLIADDLAHLSDPPAQFVWRLLGPGRTRTIARYELFLMAMRDEPLRLRLVAARDRLVATLTPIQPDLGAARAVVASADGLILDGLLRGHRDPDPTPLAMPLGYPR